MSTSVDASQSEQELGIYLAYGNRETDCYLLQSLLCFICAMAGAYIRKPAEYYRSSAHEHSALEL